MIDMQGWIKNIGIGLIRKSDAESTCVVEHCPEPATEYLEINDEIYGVYCDKHRGLICDLFQGFHPEATQAPTKPKV